MKKRSLTETVARAISKAEMSYTGEYMGSSKGLDLFCAKAAIRAIRKFDRENKKR